MRMEQNFGPHMEQKRASLNPLFGQRRIVFRLGGFRVQGKTELILPAELEARAGQFIVAVAGAGAAPGDVGRVGGDFVGDAALTDVLGVGQ
jgi:hypothetical protein